MAEVDPADDGIERFVVQHYRSGANRKSRERVALAAYDNMTEFEHRLGSEHLQLERRLAEGTADPWERIAGIQMEPGYQLHAAEKRQFMKNVSHGVARPASPSDIPEGITYMAVSEEDVSGV